MLHLAILWHQHQPLYRDFSCATPQGSYVQPWVRLHAIRDYYSMAAIVAAHPGIHLTINLTPVLLWQLDDYLDGGATDTLLELTRRERVGLAADERERLLSSFFDADWHNQIYPHPRYKELFLRRCEGGPFTNQDMTDLQMWFNLAWFGQEFREGAIELPTGDVASVRRFVEQDRGFTRNDVEAMLGEQSKILRAVVPIHRKLQESGQIEVSTTPFAHPILPLLVDTDWATIDRPGASHPRRFAQPQDAERQIRLAIDVYRRRFGARPRGMWPAEGAVAQFVVPLFARAAVRWIATDRGVLARSGRWGYEADNPEVLCQPYRAEEVLAAVSVFFRDTSLSDSIGFRLSAYPDAALAARQFVSEIEARFLQRLPGDRDHVLTVALDGENAWGAYRDDARPFLHALYGAIERHDAIRTVTFSEYLDGNSLRGVAPHPSREQTKVYELFTGSWIDERGSVPGLDFGTWIGEEEENQAWTLLGKTRDFLSQSEAMPEIAPAAFLSLFAAEGSDWFWWLGDDQESGRDDEFDELFRLHLKNVYRALKVDPPEELDRHIVPHVALWTFAQPIEHLQRPDRLSVRTNCPGVLTWRVDEGAPRSAPLAAVGGVMAGTHRYQLVLEPFPPASRTVRFRFDCTHPQCDCKDACCRSEERQVRIADGLGALSGGGG